MTVTPVYSLPYPDFTDDANAPDQLQALAAALEAALLTITGGGIPAGLQMVWPGIGSIPAGFLLCDGSAVSRTTYASLFTAIGTAYGAGNGTTTFNLPNLKGRVVVGQDATQAEFATTGQAGGVKTHTLTIGEMPAHSHTGNWGGVSASGAGTPPGSAPAATDTVGGGGPHNNMQPYLVERWVIKT